VGEIKVAGDNLIDLYGGNLTYWLYFPGGVKTEEELKNWKIKPTPEIWSDGADKNATESCLKLLEYAVGNHNCNSNHPIDTDNIGGDVNRIKK
jgi:hypothetical protein